MSTTPAISTTMGQILGEQRPPAAPLDPRQGNPTRGQVRGRGAPERVAFEDGDVHTDRLQHAETTLGYPLGPQTLGGLPHISSEEGGRVGAVLPHIPDQSACGISRHAELPAGAALCARADKKFLVRPPLLVRVQMKNCPRDVCHVGGPHHGGQLELLEEEIEQLGAGGWRRPEREGPRDDGHEREECGVAGALGLGA